ncbi:DegT/DnrJ/EryC1/StrS family aminotransferase [Mesorhizobium loti]|uniref:DegT/DnrJ/EryC1/StrS family aminotransferase n=1 Tax=Rhizobium loti TaxID=381 RepID=UPI0004168544|nr:DegT/DnrJ/EryC1/StrS aminotransferase family protein [Mesorhizobium loti]
MTQAFHQIPVARPVLDEKEALAAQRVVLSGWVTQGPEVAAFEREFAELVGAPFACAVSNCTTALHLALMAVGVGQGDEVITVSHSFIATANAIRYCGATPVFIDIESQGFNIDPNLIEAAITPRTKAIMCVHQLGMPCDLGRIVEIGKQRSIPVIEDAACAIGSEILWNGMWEKIGAPRGDIACFSFHPRKVITTGDGGMLTTGNADHDRQFRLWRQHGMSVTDAVRHGSKSVIYENYDMIGYNYRMTDLQAAIGREQLRRLPDIIASRRRIADQYAEQLQYVDGITLPVEPQWARSNWQSYGVQLPPWADQRATMQALLDRGISTRRGIMNSHLEKAYSAPGSCRLSGDMQLSTRAQIGTIILPLFAQMTAAEVSLVVDTLAEVVGQPVQLAQA